MSGTAGTLLIDTNVWLDSYLPNRARKDEAVSLLSFAYEHDYALLYATSTLKDVFYLVAAAIKHDIRQQKGALSESDATAATEIAWACVSNMREIATAVGSDESDLWLACKLKSVHADLEDNLVVAAAQRASATCLVTNDEALIKHAPVAALTPSDALAVLQTTR